MGKGEGSGKGAFLGLVLEGVYLGLDLDLELELEEVVLEEHLGKVVGVKHLKRLARDWPQRRRVLVSVA